MARRHHINVWAATNTHRHWALSEESDIDSDSVDVDISSLWPDNDDSDDSTDTDVPPLEDGRDGSIVSNVRMCCSDDDVCMSVSPSTSIDITAMFSSHSAAYSIAFQYQHLTRHSYACYLHVTQLAILTLAACTFACAWRVTAHRRRGVERRVCRLRHGLPVCGTAKRIQ